MKNPLTIALDCGCIFSADDVFRNQPLALGRACRRGAHAVFEEAEPIALAAVARDEDGLPDRIFAVPSPNRQSVHVFFDQGTFTISLLEARRVHSVIGGALAIIDGEHPIQIEAAAAMQQSTDQC